MYVSFLEGNTFCVFQRFWFHPETSSSHLKRWGWFRWVSFWGLWAYFQGLWLLVSGGSTWNLCKKVTTHPRAHPFGTPPSLATYWKESRLRKPVGKGCSGCVPNVCWNNLRNPNSQLLPQENWSHQGGSVTTRLRWHGRYWYLRWDMDAGGKVVKVVGGFGEAMCLMDFFGGEAISKFWCVFVFRELLVESKDFGCWLGSWIG